MTRKEKNGAGKTSKKNNGTLPQLKKDSVLEMEEVKRKNIKRPTPGHIFI